MHTRTKIPSPKGSRARHANLTSASRGGRSPRPSHNLSRGTGPVSFDWRGVGHVPLCSASLHPTKTPSHTLAAGSDPASWVLAAPALCAHCTSLSHVTTNTAPLMPEDCVGGHTNIWPHTARMRHPTLHVHIHAPPTLACMLKYFRKMCSNGLQKIVMYRWYANSSKYDSHPLVPCATCHQMTAPPRHPSAAG